MAGRRHHRIVDGDGGERAEHAALRAQRVHLADLLVERTAGQRHAERRLLEFAGLAILQPVAAGILALRVAPDAVVDLVQRLLRVHPGIGQREPVASAASRCSGRRSIVTPSRSMVSTGTRCCGSIRCGTRNSVLPGCAARPGLGQRRPGGVAQRDVQRLGRRPPSPTPRRARRTPRSVSGSPNRASSAARSAAPSKPDGSGYFFTAWRCTNSRLQAWIGSSAWVSRASASVSASMPNSAATNPSRCGAERHHQLALVLDRRAHPVRRAPPAAARAARHPPPRADRGTRGPAAPVRRARPGRRS